MPSHSVTEFAFNAAGGLQAVSRYVHRARLAGDKRAAIRILRDILSDDDAHKLVGCVPIMER